MGGSIGLTERHDLRVGAVAWKLLPEFERKSDLLPDQADIVIVGAGIMAATIGQRIGQSGRQVTFIDRHAPATSSTAASTAQVMCGMDMPMITLADEIGEQAAAARWKQVYQSVRHLSDHIDDLVIECAKADIPTVYLGGNKLDADGLAKEAKLHQAHDLPTEFCDAAEIAERFGIMPRPGNVSQGGFEVDPVRLALGLLDNARDDGAKICWPHNVISLSPSSGGIEVGVEGNRTVFAKDVILCTGYERPTLFLPPAFSLMSTFVIATPPGTARGWEHKAMYWEAADPYLYVRATADGRIVVGGEDIDSSATDVRDRLMPQKAGTILAKLETMLERDDLTIDSQWSATFGTSPDSLPAIGRAANSEHIWLSYGFGGNGIAFAAVAADLLSEALRGNQPEALKMFDPYRF
jgi:glycine/D-amino acid oxidase-like deaminating enzyme